MNAETCTDDRFETIAKAKEALLNETNIESSPDEMKVIDNFLFRCWQMGWLTKYSNLIPTAKNIYRNDCFMPNEIALFEKIENALGFKLYFWQKTFLITGTFRQGGFTTAECLKRLLGNNPIDFSERAKNPRENCERMQLIEIKRKLDLAEVKTVPILTCKKDIRDYREFLRTKNSIAVDEMHPKFAFKKEDKQ